MGSMWLVSDSSLERRLETHPSDKRRHLSTRSAWAAAALVDGAPTRWLTSGDRSRLRARLSGPSTTDTQTYQWWLRSRSSMTRYRLAATDIIELMATHGVVAGGISAASAYSLGLGHGAEAEIYTDAATARRLVDEFFLIESERGNLALHVVDGPDPWHQRVAQEVNGVLVAPRLIVAADLLDSDDTRSRSAGAQLLSTALSTLDDRRERLAS